MNNQISRPRNRFVAWFSFCLFAVFVASPSSAFGDDPIVITGTTMGPIVFDVTVVSPPDGVTQDDLEPEVNAALERVNSLMSTYIDTSDVSRFNNSDSTDWFEVQVETAAVVSRALEISELTDGAFDVTVSPAVTLWDFGSSAEGEIELPTDDAIEDAKKVVGFQMLDVRIDPPALKKQVAGVRIDLSAIAKGYAVDAVADILRAEGCENFLVIVGGEVFASGKSPNGELWRLGIEKPVVDRREPDSVVLLSGQALATSGDYRNFHIIDGRAYSHTIDPKTCRPVEHSLASATVIAADCMTADALATAAMVMGRDDAAMLFEQSELPYLFIERKDNDPRIESGFVHSMPESFPLADADHDEASKGQSILPVFLAAAIVFGLAILGMAVGSIFANKPVKGSCGGLSAMTGESDCGLCSKPVTDCVEQNEAAVES